MVLAIKREAEVVVIFFFTSFNLYEVLSNLTIAYLLRVFSYQSQSYIYGVLTATLLDRYIHKYHILNIN
jgi:hypothetical protein